MVRYEEVKEVKPKPTIDKNSQKLVEEAGHISILKPKRIQNLVDSRAKKMRELADKWREAEIKKKLEEEEILRREKEEARKKLEDQKKYYERHIKPNLRKKDGDTTITSEENNMFSF